jgi:hypothetical protein
MSAQFIKKQETGDRRQKQETGDRSQESGENSGL